MAENQDIVRLSSAIIAGDVDFVRSMLIQKSDLNVNAALESDQTLLHVAAERGSHDMVTLLLLRGANAQAQDSNSITPLHCAADRQDSSESVAQIVEKLCIMCPVDVQTNTLRTPLSMAVARGNIFAGQKLLQRGANPLAKDINGWTLLHFAADSGKCGIFQILSTDKLRPMAVEKTLDTGDTPLHLAALKGHLEMVNLLFEKKLAPYYVQNKIGYSALHSAISQRCWPVVESFLSRDWNPNDKMLGSETSCLHQATNLNSEQGVSMLLMKDAETNVWDSRNMTPLHYAAMQGFKEVAELLLKKKADPNLKNKEGKSPLDLADEAGNKEFRELLSRKNIETYDESTSSYMNNTGEPPDWDVLRTRNLKQYLIHKHLNNLNLFLALHRYFTFPADYDQKTRMKRQDLAHSGFFFPYNYASIQCFYCTFEIKTLDGWRNLTLDEMNEKHKNCSLKQFNAICPLMNDDEVGDVPIIDPNNYQFEAHRLYSLLSCRWTNPNVNVYDLARNGFYYTGKDDNCRCIFCKLEVRGWEQGDTPEGEHRRWNPRCTFLQPNATTNNKAIGFEQPEGVSHDSISAESIQNPFIRLDISKFGPHIKYFKQKRMASIEALGVTMVNEMKYPQYSTLPARSRSFNNWPKQLTQKPEVICQAGFFYTGMGDRVVCFQCGGGLKDWDPADNPWVEHAKWFGGCPYLSIKKGKDYINRVVHDNAEPDNASTSSPMIVPERRSEGSMKCQLCKERDVNCVSLPCGHMTSCIECRDKHVNCPVCKKPKCAYVEVFL